MDMFKEPPKTITTRSCAAKVTSIADSSPDSEPCTKDKAARINGKTRGRKVKKSSGGFSATSEAPKRRKRESSVRGVLIPKRKGRNSGVSVLGRKAGGVSMTKRQGRGNMRTQQL